MSAIVAAHGPFDPHEGRRMLDRLTHRGPDGEGTIQVAKSWLGHRRLAIVDVAGGNQPLQDHDEPGLWLVGDGEIYNHRRLRADLEAAGHTFHTGSDHESALHLLKAEGPAALSRLWGMFALVVAGGDGSFVAVRDPLGVTPLYWARSGSTVVFGSELKAFDPARRAAVEPFPPGHYWTPQDGLQAFRGLPTSPSPSVRELLADIDESEGAQPPERVLQAVRDTLVAAVERSMAADVPVGTFLSGGLDSSLVTAIAAQVARDQGWTLPTFSVGTSDSDDLRFARQLADDLGTNHHERIYNSDEAIDWVPEVIRVIESFDPMLIHSSVPNLLVAKLAARHVKVVLIGEGADELFAGYSHYGDIDEGDQLHRELLATMEGLHNLGLQRVDRVTSSTGVEARIPFLDLDVVDLGVALPAAWKLTGDGRPEKWLLRKAFEGWLPDELLWRKKAQFGQGTGTDTILRRHYEQTVSDEDLEAERDHLDPPLRTREELAYWRIFQQHLRGFDTEEVIGRFVEA
jgi:asparagine synthase (glutamine-hydrolysing)